MVLVFTLLIGGAVKAGLGQLPGMELAQQQQLLDINHQGELTALGPVLLMRAFSSGCAALTGIEAISDSVTAFRPSEWRNARRVLVVMVTMLALMFGGISVLAQHTGVVYVENGPTLLYQLGEQVFGNGPLLLFLQLATLLILLLAATLPMQTFLVWRLSLPKTAFCLASWPRWAIAWCSATAFWPSVAWLACYW
jgi:hypothetical protein